MERDNSFTLLCKGATRKNTVTTALETINMVTYGKSETESSDQ